MYRFARVLALVLAFLAAPALGQGQTPEPPAAGRSAPGAVQGTVVAAETGQPLSSVLITVLGVADSTVAGSEITDAEGRFRVANLPLGRYRVEASLTGYASYTREVALTQTAPAANLGAIPLGVSAIALEGIRVETERSDVVIAPDRTLYNTEDMPAVSGGVATDVLRNVPELEVDIEGAVSLRGAPAQIYLNGRQAPMEGEALDLFLQQLPADRIERVEVIPNPSARYDAEGATGIVNIVLRDDVDLGLSGSLFVNAGTRGEMGGGGRLAYQRGRVTLFGGGFLRHSDRDSRNYDLRQNLRADPVTFLKQDAWSERQGWSGNLDLTGEMEIGERSTIWSEVEAYRSDLDSEGLTAYISMDFDRLPTERYDRASISESQRLSTEVSLGFRHVPQPQRHEFSAELRAETGGDDEDGLIRETPLTPGGEPVGLPIELTDDMRAEDETELSLDLDYVRPWGEEGRIELGYRGEREDTENRRLLEIFGSEDASVPVSAEETGFGFRETSHALYAILGTSRGPLGVQAGLRAEWAGTRLELPETEQVFQNDYASLFPSANLSYDLGGGRRIDLSYTRRVRRPPPWVLNPINRSSEPLNRSVGNPDIDPQYTQSLSLGTSWTAPMGTLRFSPYYRHTEGDWARIQTVDSLGVSTTTWENLASIDAYGTSLTASLRPIGGVSGSASLSGHREVRDASNLALDYSGDALRWSARGNLSAEITPSLSAQGMFDYTPAHDVPQGRVSSTIMTHFGVRQRLWDDRASLNLMVVDPFDLFDYSFETRVPTFVQIGRSDRSIRRAVLSFSYSFGRPPEENREREFEEPEPGEPGEPGIP